VAVVRMKQLLESGVHFGHRSRRWNPKMRQYIFTERNGIHIIDLQQTMRALERAHEIVRDLVAEGGTIVFVGTKRQAQENIAQQALRCGMPYVTDRWLGGTLTNFRTIRGRIDYMLDLEAQKARDAFSVLPKKEVTLKTREMLKLQRRLGGLRNLYRLPEALFIADVMTEDIAVKEANRLNIPVIAMVDTNCNPDPIDLVIPSNDDAIRAIQLISGKIADAVIEGQQMRGVIMEDQGETAELPEYGAPTEYTVAPEEEEYVPAADDEDVIVADDDEVIVADDETDNA